MDRVLTNDAQRIDGADVRRGRTGTDSNADAGAGEDPVRVSGVLPLPVLISVSI